MARGIPCLPPKAVIFRPKSGGKQLRGRISPYPLIQAIKTALTWIEDENLPGKKDIVTTESIRKKESLSLSPR